MDKSEAALGATATVEVCSTMVPADLSAGDRILLLEEQMKHMQRILMRMKKNAIEDPLPVPATETLNKDGIPIGITCIGATERSHFLFYLTVEPEGYRIGSVHFASLSAAAEAASQVRRSGWTFWKLLDGRTLKEVYRS
jgi:hypothetical protein